jgi:hypothetical protein
MNNLTNLVQQTKESINHLNSLLEEIKPIIKEYGYFDPEYYLLKKNILMIIMI